MRVRYLLHETFEGPAWIGGWMAASGADAASTHLYRGDRLPDLAEVDFLVVMGGSMGVNDMAEHPWLAEEKAFIAGAIGAGKPVLGVCLGAQLIAAALGARVYRNEKKEIGWFPIAAVDGQIAQVGPFSFPKELMVFHWHGDTFDLPAGAVHLAHSAGCVQQAFSYGGHVVGLQCHLEATPESVRMMVESGGGELAPGRYIQTTANMLAGDGETYAEMHSVLDRILATLALKAAQ